MIFLYSSILSLQYIGDSTDTITIVMYCNIYIYMYIIYVLIDYIYIYIYNPLVGNCKCIVILPTNSWDHGKAWDHSLSHKIRHFMGWYRPKLGRRQWNVASCCCLDWEKPKPHRQNLAFYFPVQYRHTGLQKRGQLLTWRGSRCRFAGIVAWTSPRKLSEAGCGSWCFGAGQPQHMTLAVIQRGCTIPVPSKSRSINAKGDGRKIFLIWSLHLFGMINPYQSHP